MAGIEHAEEIGGLQTVIEELRERIVHLESQAESTARELQETRDAMLLLLDEVVAAERDQQELKSLRARLSRVELRGLVARIRNR